MSSSGESQVRAWTFLALGGSRQFAGNAGYDDRLARHYSYDSTVPNSREVAVGDIAVPRDSDGALGLAWIAEIKPRSDRKLRRRCPECKTTALKTRRSKEPLYRCDSGHEFDHPADEMIDVIAYRADYREWVPLNHALTARDLRPLYRANAQQHAIRQLDFDAFRAAVQRTGAVRDPRWWDGLL